jgi:hypothetical protein
VTLRDLTAAAKSPVQSGDELARSFRLLVGGRDRSALALSASGSYSSDAGSSEMTVQLGAPLEGYADAPAVLEVGYGAERIPYFEGRLQEPDDDWDELTGTAKAYGPFKALASQQLGEQVTHRGIRLHQAYADLFARAGYPRGVYEVVGGNQVVDEVVFPEETTILEAVTSYNESFGMVALDRPRYRKLVMPRPRLGATGKVKAVYGPQHYPPGGFRVRRANATRYGRVVVFRRDENGLYPVRQEVPVENRGRGPQPPKNRVYYVPDFKGSQEQAAQEGYSLARMLSNGGQIGFELSGLSLDPNLLLYDQVAVEELREEPVPDAPNRRRRWRVRYKCLIDEDLAFEVAAESHDMDLSGTAIETGRDPVVERIEVFAGAVSPGVVAAPPPDALVPRSGLVPSKTLLPRAR